jgi:hypothetical protein
MRFCLIHVHSGPCDGPEEVALIVPGADQLAVLVPLDVLPEFLPILHGATDSLGEQRCPSCDDVLPGARA